MKEQLLQRQAKLTADLNFITGALIEVNTMIAEIDKVVLAPQAQTLEEIASNVDADTALVPTVDSGLTAE